MLNDQELENVVGGITQNDAELDYEWGKQVYEIEFYYNGMEYEYKIDTATGSILKAKKDWDD